MTQPSQIVQNIITVIKNSNQLEDITFRLKLEKLVRQGSDEAEAIISRLLTSKELDSRTRQNIIRVAGYLQSSIYIVPLKKIIDEEENIYIKKEAIISVSKYNDRRALNILNNALTNIQNPLLLKTINSEIAQIKQNNPILALLPRFLKGATNTKTFNVTIEILKRILSPQDCTTFLKFLNHEDEAIQIGAFDILCARSDSNLNKFILDFFKTKVSTTGCVNQPECDPLNHLLNSLKSYFVRFPDCIRPELKFLTSLFDQVLDQRAKGLIVQIMAKYGGEEIYPVIEKIYYSEEKLRQTILEAVAGNENAKGFLLQRLNENDHQHKYVIRSLLSTTGGLEYFTEKFFDQSLDDQEIIVNHIPFRNQKGLLIFIQKIFNSDLFGIKQLLLKQINKNVYLAAKEILFDPKHQREFKFMEGDYIDTVLQLFPVLAVERIFERLISESISVKKSKIYLDKIEKVCQPGLVFNFEDKELIVKLISKILLSNNSDLNISLLTVISQIKTFSLATYHGINNGLSMFLSKRGARISAKEKGAVSKVKSNLNNMIYDLKKIDEGLKKINSAFEKELFDPEHLKSVLDKYPMSLALIFDKICKRLNEKFELSPDDQLSSWLKLLKDHPGIARSLKKNVSKKIAAKTGMVHTEVSRLLNDLPDSGVKITVLFSDSQIRATLLDQFSTILTNLTINTNQENVSLHDILICEGDLLKNLMLNEQPIPKQIFLSLKSNAEFVNFKEFKPRILAQPFVYYRVLKEVLPEIY